MGHNPSRRTRQTVATATQYDVDVYKQRSIWGSWKGLDREIRARYFGADETAWLNRYGSRLDQLSSLTVERRNEAEKFFVGVCLKHHAPKTERHRLWLRAQMVVRYEASLERAALCGEAMRERDAILARCLQLEADLHDLQRDVRGTWAEAEVAFGDRWQTLLDRRRGLANVARVAMWPPPTRPERTGDAIFAFGTCQ